MGLNHRPADYELDKKSVKTKRKKVSGGFGLQEAAKGGKLSTNPQPDATRFLLFVARDLKISTVRSAPYLQKGAEPRVSLLNGAGPAVRLV